MFAFMHLLFTINHMQVFKKTKKKWSGTHCRSMGLMKMRMSWLSFKKEPKMKETPKALPRANHREGL